MNKINKIFESSLKKRLAKLPVQKLLEEMNNNNYYFPYNVWKRYFDNKSIEGGKRISWFATRQAEKLDDKAEAEKLKSIIENKNLDRKIREKAYFCLGHLSRNLADQELFEFVTNKLTSESEDIQETILISIREAKKAKSYNLDPILSILRGASLRMKTIAAIALKYAENPEVESELLNSFQKESDKHLQQMIAATLRTTGTEKSIPIIENKLKTAKGADYRYFLESALDDIRKRLITAGNRP